MIQKPENQKPGVLSFMEPFSTTVWIWICFAYIGANIVLYIVTRFSPYEWYVKSDSHDGKLVNDFNFGNTLWFCLAAILQQGVDIAPKSPSGRMAASGMIFIVIHLYLNR